MIISMDSWLIGREAVLDRAGRALAASGEVLLEGPAGIGKTAVWQVLREDAERNGALVLVAAPAESERSLPYGALADLLRPLTDLIPDLPKPQRNAAEVVLFGQENGESFDDRAIGAATRSLLEAAVARDGDQAILIAIDDAPWLDQQSERAIAFALRRLNRRPALLIASRTEGSEPALIPLGLARSGPSLLRLPLTRLGVGALHHILRARLDVTFSRPLLSRIAADSGGNPLLAIELARAVVRLPHRPGPGEDLPVAASVHQLLAGAIAALPADTQAAVRLVSLMTAPTPDDLVAAGVSLDSLDAAEQAGLLVVGPTTVRFGHPMHAVAVRAAIPTGARRSLQQALADCVTSPDERARQLARSTVGSDAGVAQELEEAARRQRTRGAPELAAELYDRSAALTPAKDADDRSRRLLAGTRCRFDSGDHPAAAAAAAAADHLMTGGARGEALLLRATMAFITQGHVPAVVFADEALGIVSPTSPMAGRIHAHLCVFHDSPEAAVRHGRAALALFDDVEEVRGVDPFNGDRFGQSDPDDTELLCSVLLLLFYNEVRAGGRPRQELLDRALRIEGPSPPWLGGTIPALWWTAVDQHDRAADRMEQHLAHAVAHGDEPLQLEVTLHLVQSELLAGRWSAASEHLDQARVVGEQLRSGLDEQNYLSSLLAVYRGDLETIGPVVDAGLARAEELGDSWGRRVYRGLAGQIALAREQFAEAAAIFGTLTADLRAQGLAEPLATRLEPDWIEACVGVGDLETAAQALEGIAARHDRLPRPWTALGLARSRVLLAAAAGRDTGPALDEMAEAMHAPGAEVLPLDQARCLLIAGLAHRRARRKREAREALTGALAGFTALGANAFADRARRELTRVGTRVADSQKLTATEQRVADLAAGGRTNRVIAELLFISPKTVEANLARVYRKLGISTRAELGSFMAQGLPHGRVASGAPTGQVVPATGQHRR